MGNLNVELRDIEVFSKNPIRQGKACELIVKGINSYDGNSEYLYCFVTGSNVPKLESIKKGDKVNILGALSSTKHDEPFPGFPPQMRVVVFDIQHASDSRISNREFGAAIEKQINSFLNDIIIK